MKKNLYYREVYQRSNIITQMLMSFFLAISSWPRLVLEVFLRRNMGERYFNFGSVLVVFLILILIPGMLPSNAYHSGFMDGNSGYSSLFADFWSWYLFSAVFLIMGLVRGMEIVRLPSVFDFSRFSLSTGIVHPLFYKIRIGNKRPSIRTIETILEPLFCFLVGLLLSLLGQAIGFIITSCSIVYAVSYAASYRLGDNFVMDKIDEIICNEELMSSFVEGREPSETRGFNAYGRRPADPQKRRTVTETFWENSDFREVK